MLGFGFSYYGDIEGDTRSLDYGSCIGFGGVALLVAKLLVPKQTPKAPKPLFWAV